MSLKRFGIKSDFKVPDNYKHIATSYQISKSMDFDAESLVYNIEKDEENLYSRVFDLDFTNRNYYYGRVTIHLEDKDGNEYLYGPLKPVMLTNKDEGYSLGNTIIKTPEIYLNGEKLNEVSIDSDLIVSTSEFAILKGLGYHKYTNWVLKDLTTDKIVFSSIEDEDNLLSIKIPSNLLKSNRVYNIEVRHITNSYDMSNKGVLTFKTVGDNKDVDKLDYGEARIIKKERDELENVLLICIANHINDLSIEYRIET